MKNPSQSLVSQVSHCQTKPISALDIREIAFALTGLNQVDIKAKVK